MKLEWLVNILFFTYIRKCQMAKKYFHSLITTENTGLKINYRKIIVNDLQTLFVKKIGNQNSLKNYLCIPKIPKWLWLKYLHVLTSESIELQFLIYLILEKFGFTLQNSQKPQAFIAILLNPMMLIYILSIKYFRNYLGLQTVKPFIKQFLKLLCLWISISHYS